MEIDERLILVHKVTRMNTKKNSDKIDKMNRIERQIAIYLVNLVNPVKNSSWFFVWLRGRELLFLAYSPGTFNFSACSSTTIMGLFSLPKSVTAALAIALASAMGPCT